MQLVCLDLEGVLVPEIWIEFSKRAHIPALSRTTRDEPDYDKLMTYRLNLLKQHRLGLPDIQKVIAEMGPMQGARDFLDALRRDFQVIILSDTFYEFAMPLMAQLGMPALFCHKLEADAQGYLVNYHLRMPNQKKEAVKRFKELNFKVIAAGDSYNDTAMLGEAHAGILFHPPQNVIDEFPQFPVTLNYAELRAAIDGAQRTHMNPNLNLLHPYPFQKLRELFAGMTPNPALKPINLSIGEPKHATPTLVKSALTANLNGLANYPTTQGVAELRQAIGNWISRRYGIPALDIEKQIIPVNGSREALFAFAQAVIDPTSPNPVVLSPNPFYQIYEGAALLAGAEPYYLNTLPDNGFRIDFSAVPESVWRRVQLLYVCSPGNPTGKVMNLDDWREIFALADQYGFVVASDECYSEIYFEEGNAPLGALQAAHQLGRGFERLVMFSSLSKRSNVPGMRSGFVAGDAKILEKFLLYRTYHGCAMNPAIQSASAAAWNDEAHVVENRRLYAEKFHAVTPLLQKVMQVEMPDAAFYLWGRVQGSDTEFTCKLYEQAHVTVLPGSFLAREAHGVNPGAGFVRIALVASLEECLEAAERVVAVLR